MGKRRRRPVKAEHAHSMPIKQFPTQNYIKTEKKNEDFEHYYKVQNVVPDGEWERFMEACKDNLPTVFRLTGHKSEAQELLAIIKSEYFSKMSNIELDGMPIEPPKCLEWFPDGLAWQVNYSRSEIRKTDNLKELHEFLISETESGNISRQEAVSMIPPLLMDIEPQHKILDMCAAPGSKTAQLIETLHSNEEIAIPDGFVVANDANNKRCYLMVHQVKRLQSPCVIIINHDASNLPNLKITSEEGTPIAVTYDRILADVPCSGDGTMRKNPDIWRKWNAGAAIGLHNLQVGILARGINLLNVGGRIVYSTCSLNPIENEAVVAELLQQCKGCLKLLDITACLPGLKTIPGLKKWKVMNKQKEWFDTWDTVPTNYYSYMKPSLFPPSEEAGKVLNLERCIRILPHHQDTGGFFVAVLEKTDPTPVCAVPKIPSKRSKIESNTVIDCNTETNEDGSSIHTMSKISTDVDEQVDNDTTKTEVSNDATNTGEPITKLDDITIAAPDSIKEEEKIEIDESSADTGADVSDAVDVDETQNVESMDDETQPVIDEEIGNENATNKRKEELSPMRRKKIPKIQRGYKEDPFIYLKADEPILLPVKEFFNFSDEFPLTNLLVRCETGKKRNVYFTSSAVKDLVVHNEDTVKIINLGVKIFSRSDSPISGCPYRLTNEGLECILPFMRSRIIHIEKSDIIILLSQENPYISKLTQKVQDMVKPIVPGALAFVYDPNVSTGPRCPIILCGWRGKTSCRSFVPKEYRSHFLRLCGVKVQGKEVKSLVEENNEEEPQPNKLDEENISEDAPQANIEEEKTL